MRLPLLMVLIFTFGCTAPQKTEPEPLPVEIKTLGSYVKAGDMWRNIVVPENIDTEQLIILARNLFKREPKSRYRIFTDDKQFDAFVQSDINYPNSKYPYPEDWANKHYIAIINNIAGEGWVLSAIPPAGLKHVRGDSETIVRLE